MAASVREADTTFLWTRARSGDYGARAALIERHRPYVAQVVGRLGVPTTTVVDREDLLSAGTVGLIDAIDRFDPDRKVPFEAYAATRIRGAVLDEVRRMSMYGRAVWRAARELRAAAEAIAAETGRTPSRAELGAATALDGERLRIALEARGSAQLSLDQLVDDGAEPVWTWDDPAQPILERDLRDEVQRALRELPEREHRVLAQIYGQSLTLREIGVRLGVSEARVCQLHARAISQIRRLVIGHSKPARYPTPAA